MRIHTKKSANICDGPILKSMILYALPLIATNLLQLLFNAADVAVLALFAEGGDGAVAAVGATGSLIQLIINVFVGLSVGTNVLVARCVGSGDTERSRRIVGCSVTVSVLGGIALLFVGVFGARTFLTWTQCDAEVLDMATLYLKIYFLGMPIIMLYNFSTAVLRGVGDTFRPLLYLIVGGVVNVALNVLFVVGFKKDVEGVAIATVSSQGVSAALAIIALCKEEGAAKLTKKHLRLYGRELADMAKIGLPSGLQGSLFSISNVLVQSSINVFGKTAMAANTIASQYDTCTYQAMYGVSLASTVFVSQNYGAKRYDRVKRSALTALGLTTATGLIFGGLIALFARPLCSIMTDDAQTTEYAVTRTVIISVTYFLCGLQEVFAYSLRGLGKSMTAMFVVLGGTCVFRIIWLKTVLVKYHTLTALYLLYPASWLLTALIFVPIFIVCLKDAKKKLSADGSSGGSSQSYSL
ncbi:MAG: MATE family efflux transporter [Candidatus Borkfalkiaceae bacterium]|nr:MATE family efflux transporter [Clostridia bacterium]MDY6223167.1 MATE family efflux transporter [Christensenellaceae bacterium]